MDKIEKIREWRRSSQFTLPDSKPELPYADYDIYPSFQTGPDCIESGFDSLARIISQYKIIIIEGYIGVFYDQFRDNLNDCLKTSGKIVSWRKSSDFFKDETVIASLADPFTGGDDPVFGKRTNLVLRDFFDLPSLKNCEPQNGSDINIIIGPGASLSGWNGLLIYLDLPKNEIQFRSRAQSISNLGAGSPADPGEMYKRFYFVDWVVLNKHKKELLSEIDIIVDTQRPSDPVWMTGKKLRESFSVMSHNVFRVRPWFEPGVWGGSWIKDHISGLNKDVPNYAWSFELIVPENGLLFESSGKLLEVSFDCLMYQEARSVLGDCYGRFDTEFPIRFDFLDTFDGGNLSIQCHPRPEYMKNNFGEAFTQEETYYILDTKDDAIVYLGFQDDIDSQVFKNELEKSHQKSQPVDIEKFVLKHPSKKHDLFLIPYGTIHGSGKNNLVLEISSTPYIFTFKLYDWLRMDLSGKPRPLNIKRGMANLFFDRKGDDVRETLISKPVLISESDDWQTFHLPTHETHLYDVHRHHLKNTVVIETKNKCHVMSLVEGSAITIETGGGYSQRFNYAETFVIPAAAGRFKIINDSDEMAIVVDAFVK